MTEQIGKYRPAENVQPGWHARNAEGDWLEIALVMETRNFLTGQRSVHLRFTDGSGGAVDRGEDVMCRTAAEARRAAKETTR